MTLTGSTSMDTQAALLLTAPLVGKRREPSVKPLQPNEYRRFTSFLQEDGWHPADLLTKDAEDVLAHDRLPLDPVRLRLLLERGFHLSQAMEQWQSRAIWVIGVTDDVYPSRMMRLGKNAPPVLYGCGERALLERGGLAVVGSRNADEDILRYTELIGGLVARSEHMLVSGGARGVDQAAMRGALESGGRVLGVLSSDLQRAALQREHRELLIEGQLLLISPYDPAAGFNTGNAMHRNKMIYAMADAALVVSSDFRQGGTWAGAVEQLDKLKLVPVYVRSERGTAFDALIRKGAHLWPDPETPEALQQTLALQPAEQDSPMQASFW